MATCWGFSRTLLHWWLLPDPMVLQRETSLMLAPSPRKAVVSVLVGSEDGGDVGVEGDLTDV